jgi:hypothetical protein
MPLHIFLGDEELLYFIVRVEVIEIQILFEFKLVCNLQKGLKIYKGFSIFLRHWAEFPVSVQPASSCAWSTNGPSHAARSDPISLEPDPNPLSYPLSRLFKPILFPFQFLLNLREIEFDSN